MSEDAMNFLDLLYEETICCYCGNQYCPSWYLGPCEEIELCHFCGSSLRKGETLKDHIPEQANEESQSYQPSGRDQSSLLGNVASAGSTSTSNTVSSKDYTEKQNMDEILQSPLGVPSKGKTPVVEQLVPSPPERLQEQLCNKLQSLAISKSDDEEDVLIYHRINHYIPENEIGLGCILLKPSVSPPEDPEPELPAMFTFTASASKTSKSQSSTVSKSRASFSTGCNKGKTSIGSKSLTFPSKTSKPEASPALNSDASVYEHSHLEFQDVPRSQISAMKDFMPECPSPKDDISLIAVPIREASQEEIPTFQRENIVDVSEKTRRDINSYQEDDLHRRSRVCFMNYVASLHS